MTLEQRMEKAKKLTFVSVLSDGTEVGTWGSKDDFYRIKLTQSKDCPSTKLLNKKEIAFENIDVECIQFGTNCNCEGNSCQTICYHAMGALMFILGNRGQEIEFCRDEFIATGTVERDDWDRSINNSHFALISSKPQRRGSMWAVIRDKVRVVDHGDMGQRINSMRGNEAEEEGID